MAQSEAGPNLNNLPKTRDRILKGMVRCDDTRADMKEIYLKAKDDHFHIKALKLTIRLFRMEPPERNDFLSSLNAYCDALGITGEADLLGDTPRTPEPMSVVSEPSPAWQGGRQAALAGDSQNPWDVSDARHDNWAKGYAAGEQEIADGLADPPAPKTSRKRNGASSEPTEPLPAA